MLLICNIYEWKDDYESYATLSCSPYESASLQSYTQLNWPKRGSCGLIFTKFFKKVEISGTVLHFFLSARSLQTFRLFFSWRQCYHNIEPKSVDCWNSSLGFRLICPPLIYTSFSVQNGILKPCDNISRVKIEKEKVSTSWYTSHCALYSSLASF